MPWLARVGPLVLALLLLAPAGADETQPGEAKPGEAISWIADLPAGFAAAKEKQRVLMICVNARFVSGREGEEPAGKGLREVVYRDARIVEKSRAFVCVRLTREGSSKDYGELRVLGIDGDIVSPQHIFVHPDGERILLRREYWSHGKGERAVEALLDMMEKALEKAGGAAPAAAAAAPPDGPARAEWIERMVRQVLAGSAAEHEVALASLVENDQEGDCILPLVPILDEHKKNTGLIVSIVRSLGRDGLESAALPLASQLGHKDASVRGHTAVSLEYVGSRNKKVVAALKKAAGKEKNEGLANHMYRALGRCGVGDAKARTHLLKKADSAKSEFASYGPTIGLAYFEGDAKAARGVEKILKKIGVPGGRRGGGQNTVKRGLLSWTLASIGDPKSGDFVREELIAKLENVQAFWVGGLTAFYESVAHTCDGDREGMAGIEEGVRRFVAFARGGQLGRYGAEIRGLMDEYRLDRGSGEFKPKGDNVLGGAGGG